jgi:hypothetical protein
VLFDASGGGGGNPGDSTAVTLCLQPMRDLRGDAEMRGGGRMGRAGSNC